MSGKIITRVRRRQEQAPLRQLWLMAMSQPEPPLVWLLGFLKNWRQWFFKDGRDGGM